MPIRSKWIAPKNWVKLRKKVLERDAYQCQVCNAKVGKGGRRSHVHHIHGRRGRSADSLGNLLSLCATCHTIVSLLSGNAKALTSRPELLEKAVTLAKEYLAASTR